LLSSRRRRRTLAISTVIGNVMAATACSDMKNDMNAFIRKRDRRSVRGVCPKRRRIVIAMRVESPHFMRVAARMKAPRMKKTASFPKSA
jgi:hypothetical protein